MKKTITDYWYKFFVSDEHHCSLCGNCGIIDTRGVCTLAGAPAGRLNWCICPNGQTLRKASDGKLPTTRY